MPSIVHVSNRKEGPAPASSNRMTSLPTLPGFENQREGLPGPVTAPPPEATLSSSAHQYPSARYAFVCDAVTAP